MITFTQPDNTQSYPPGAVVTFGGTLGPPTRCALRQPDGTTLPVPIPPGLVANWQFNVTLPAAPGTYTYEVEAAGEKEAVRTLVVGPPGRVPIRPGETE
jgi:hypothetical protein